MGRVSESSDGQRTPSESVTRPPTIETTVPQALTGVELAEGGKTACADCNRPLREGDPVGLYAKRAEGVDADPAFDGFRVRCQACRRDSIDHSTASLTEVIVFGRLAVVTDRATRRARLTVRDLDVVANAPVSGES